MIVRFECRLVGGRWHVIDYKKADAPAIHVYTTEQPAWEAAELGNSLLSNRPPRPYRRPTHHPKAGHTA